MAAADLWDFALLVPDFAVLARLPFVDFADLAVEALDEAKKECRVTFTF